MLQNFDGNCCNGRNGGISIHCTKSYHKNPITLIIHDEKCICREFNLSEYNSSPTSFVELLIKLATSQTDNSKTNIRVIFHINSSIHLYFIQSNICVTHTYTLYHVTATLCYAIHAATELLPCPSGAIG